MARRDARVLRDEVAGAIDKGKFKQALEAIRELEALEPNDASWPKRAAEVYRRIGKHREAIQAYERAVDRYAQAGFLVQSIAVCKQILQLDPQHGDALHRLAQMSAHRSSTSSLPAMNIPEYTIGSRNTGPIPMIDPATLMQPDRDVAMLELEQQPPRRAHTHSSVSFLPTEADLSDPDADFELPPLPQDDPPPPPLPLPRTRPTTVEFRIPSPATQPGPPPATPPPIPPRRMPPPVPPPRPGARGTPDDLRRRRASSSPIAISPGAPLDTVPLAEVFSQSSEATGDGTSSGIIVIPLDEVDDATGPIDIEPLPAHGVRDDTFEVGLDAVDTPDDDDRTPEELELIGLAEDDEHPLGAPQMLSQAARRALGATPLLSGLAPELLEDLVERLDLVHLEAGAILFREGDPGDTLYVISEGEVAVVSEGPPRREISRLFTGSFFGEMSLVTDAPRSATIQAISRTELLAIDRNVIAALITDHPEVLKVILRFIKNRLVERVMQTSPLFVQFPPTERRGLAERFEFIEVEPGTALVSHGARPDGLYVLLAGRAEVLRKLDDDATRSIGWLGIGEVFGEMSLWSSEVSLATVIARGKMLALRMPAATFREVIMTHPQVLAYVGDLAEARRRELEAPPEDSGDVVDLKLDLI